MTEDKTNLCYLDQSSLGNTQEVDHDWQFLHKLRGDVAESRPLEPVQNKVQVGSDLDRSRPREQTIWRGQKWSERCVHSW